MSFQRICLSPHRRGKAGLTCPQPTPSDKGEKDTVNIISTDGQENPQASADDGTLEMMADFETSRFSFAVSAWKPPTTHLPALQPLLPMRNC